MGVEAYQFVSALNCVLAQRLVRNICTQCKRRAVISRAQLEESALDPALEFGGHFYGERAVSSAAGRATKDAPPSATARSERHHPRTDSGQAADLRDQESAREEGMRFLRESAVEQVLLGRTTLREINKVTFVE